MFKVELPYDIGTFVKITDPLFERKERSRLRARYYLGAHML